MDQFSDSGSDNKNKFEMKVQKVEDLLKEFEIGDDKMKKVRADPATYTTQYSTELDKLNKNIS